MSRYFEPETNTVKKLFQGLYKIPVYQRNYSWEDDQLDNLWDDLFTSFQNNLEVPKNYFLGSIITTGDPNSYEDVIDGQQRITTLLILFSVIRRNFSEINNNRETEDNTSIVTIRTIENSIFDQENRNRLKFKTHNNAQNEFENVIIKNNDFSTYNIPPKKDIKNKQKARFINAAVYFYNKLNELSELELGDFINYIFNQVEIIKIRCNDTSFAIKMFQVLNTRGLELSNADLIKSYLISKLDQELRPQFVSSWNNIENIISGLDISMDNLLTYYEYYTLGENPKGTLYEELEEEFKNKDSNEIVLDIKEFTECYRENIYNSDSKKIHSLSYLNWTVYWKTVILTAYHTDYPNKEELIDLMIRYFYLNRIAGKILSTIKQTTFSVISAIKDNKSIDEIEKILDDHLEKLNIVENALENLKGDIYHASWGKPLLLIIEYKTTNVDEYPFIPWDRKLHIDHIIPLNYKNKPEWNHISDDLFEEYGNTLGNLTLLTGSTNIQASDRGFSEKVNIYDGLGLYPDNDINRSKGITNFKISEKIIKDYNESKFNKEWNEEALKDRFNWMLYQIEKLLNIDTSRIKK